MTDDSSATDAKAKELLAQMINKHPDMYDMLWEYTTLCLKVGGDLGVAACAEVFKGGAHVGK